MKTMTRPHEHRWVAIKPGFPQKICKCGFMKVGTHTVLLSDLIRYTSTKASVAPGELGMNVGTGRPSAFIGGADSPLAALSDIGASQYVEAVNSLALGGAFANLSLMTFTPVTGTYLVWGSFQASAGATAQDIGAAIAVAGVTIGASSRVNTKDLQTTAHAMARVTVTGVEAITLQGRHGGLPASYSIRQLMIARTL